MGCDGSNPVNLTDNDADDREPSWAKGGRLAFSSNRDAPDGGADKFDIYLLDLESEEISRLTTNTSSDISPALSPDGGRVAFVSYRDGNAEIYVMTIADKSVVKITDDAGKDLDPAWAPDGETLAFASDRDGDFDLYKVKPDGSGLATPILAANDVNDRWPDWGRDADGEEYIAFASDRLQNWKLHLVHSNVSETLRITYGGIDTAPSFGPSMTEIVFHSNRDTDAGIYRTLNLEGDDTRKISGKSGNTDSAPDWEPTDHAGTCGAAAPARAPIPRPTPAPVSPPDSSAAPTASATSGPVILPEYPAGGRIAFQTNRDDNSEIYVMGCNGYEPAQPYQSRRRGPGTIVGQGR